MFDRKPVLHTGGRTLEIGVEGPHGVGVNSEETIRARTRPLVTAVINLMVSAKPAAYFLIPRVVDNGVYYLCIPYRAERPVAENQGRVVALDLGIRTFPARFSEESTGWIGLETSVASANGVVTRLTLRSCRDQFMFPMHRFDLLYNVLRSC